MKTIILLALLAGGLTAPALANEDADWAEANAPETQECLDNAAATSDQLECLGTAYEYWDKVLNDAYKQRRADCDKTSNPKACKDKLKAAQIKWIKYKEKHAAELSDGNGSLGRVEGMSFTVDQTKKRALFLINGEAQ